MDDDFLQQFRQHFAVLHRRRALVVTCLLVSLAAATMYNIVTRPVYQATTQILIERETPDVLPGKDLMNIGKGADYLNTQFNLLRGRGLAEKVVERLSLQRSPDFASGPIMSPWERFQRTILRRSPSVPPTEMALTPAARAFQARLSIEPVPNSSLVNIRCTGYDPVLAARAVNTLAQLYIEQSLEFRFTTSSEATGWLSERMKDQKKRLEEAEKALQAYREKEGLENVDERRGLIEQKLTTLTGAVLNARTERITKETLVSQMRSLSPAQLATHLAVLGNGQIQSLRGQLAELQREAVRLSETVGEKHPDMVRVRSEQRALEDKLAAETQNIVRSAETDYRTAQQQESNLQASLDAIKAEANEINRKSIDFGVLRREVESNQQMFQNLMNRSKETGLESELRSTNIRVVEKAEIPQAPIAPRRAWNYQVAVLVGLGVGIALVIAAEQLDSTIKTPEDAKQHVRIPFLGMVADAAARKANTPGNASPLILKNPRSALADAYRVIRTNIIFSSAETTARALVISSVNPAEGKSTTVVNVAGSLSQNGARVLVIDADLRRPTIHTHFGINSSPGLSDVIVGKATPQQAIRTTPYKGLDVLPCGYVPPNPAELLGSAVMKDLLVTLRREYDYILIDTPPVLAMADTPVLCRLTDGLVLVVAAESTSRQAIHRTIDQIVSVGGRLTGMVLNRVNLERNSYYFNQYYGEYYRSYYADAPAARATGSPRPAKESTRRQA
jgi:succinoglycan biosynthesis transport protein ExoP